MQLLVNEENALRVILTSCASCSIEWHFCCQSNANIVNNYVLIKSTIHPQGFHPFCFQTPDSQLDQENRTQLETEGLMDFLVSRVVLYS